MNVWNQVKTVLWSFIGIGGRRKDAKVNILVVIAVAFVLVVLFLGTLAFIAKQAVVAG